MNPSKNNLKAPEQNLILNPQSAISEANSTIRESQAVIQGRFRAILAHDTPTDSLTGWTMTFPQILGSMETVYLVHLPQVISSLISI